jgi:hypothetical protein
MDEKIVTGVDHKFCGAPGNPSGSVKDLVSRLYNAHETCFENARSGNDQETPSDCLRKRATENFRFFLCDSYEESEF